QELENKSCPIYIYHFGDSDPSGENAAEKIEEDLQGFAPTADINFKRLAVTEEQIRDWNLPTRPTKRSDTRAASFGSRVSVELDAIEPRRLRSLVEKAILKHMTRKKYDELMIKEKREQEKITELIEQIINEEDLEVEDDNDDDDNGDDNG